MSQVTAKALIDKMMHDQEFKNELLAIEDVQQRMERIHELGYDCTLEDIQAVQDQLSDKELDAVAGGYGCECRGERVVRSPDFPLKP